MIYIKTKEEIKILRQGGKHLAAVLEMLRQKAVSGVSTKELDLAAEKMIREFGDEPAFLNYRPLGAAIPFPATLCISVNDEVVHGIPRDKRILKDGDVVSLDTGLKHQGLFTDAAITVAVGEVTEAETKLMAVTKLALQAGVAAAIPGNTTGDIGAAVEAVVRPHGYGIIRILSGHGVGREIHEDPYIPNFGHKGKGEKLVAGMVIAIEPMITLSSPKIYLAPDQWTYITNDHSVAAHFEHTVAILENGPEILTKIN